jgi:hypothetical protein
MLQVSVLTVLDQPHRREFQLWNSAVGRNLRGSFLERLVFALIERRLMDYVPTAFYGAVVVVSPAARAASSSSLS